MEHEHQHHEVSGKSLWWTILLNMVITIAEGIGGLLFTANKYRCRANDKKNNKEIMNETPTMWLVHKGFRVFRAISLALNLGGILISMMSEIPYAPYTQRWRSL